MLVRKLSALTVIAGLSGLSACTVYSETPAYYPRASTYSPAYAYGGAPAAAQPYDSYCAEAVGEAQDAAAQAALTGRQGDIARARRSAGYAQRDC
ncbi:MAG: hypothetical protein IRY87_16315 [Acetobacteraceae bacterium]|nr:hypothetical protein [Acetobacteraceae bacterium]